MPIQHRKVDVPLLKKCVIYKMIGFIDIMIGKGCIYKASSGR